MATLSGTLTILSAMFTPSVLVSAGGSLIFTTSQRLSRSLDRQREVAGLLLYASLLLIQESRLAMADVREENEFLTKLTQTQQEQLTAAR